MNELIGKLINIESDNASYEEVIVVKIESWGILVKGFEDKLLSFIPMGEIQFINEVKK